MIESRTTMVVIPPLKFPKFIIRKVGLWQKDTDSWFYLFYGITLNLIFIVSISFCQGVYLYEKFQEGNIQEIADVLNVLVTMIGITSKAIWFVVKMQKFKKMLKTLNKLLSFEPFDQTKERVNVERRMNQLRKVEKLNLFCTPLIIGGTVLQTIFAGGSKQLPFETWFYWDYKNNGSLFWALAVHQNVHIIYACLCGYSFDIIPNIFIALTTAAFEELSEEISCGKSENLSNRLDQDQLENCIKYHIELKKFSEEISANLSFNFLYQTLFSSVILCTSSFLLSTLSFVNFRVKI
jgi:hypothetical protein